MNPTPNRRRLYVGGLRRDCTKADVSELFNEIGEIFDIEEFQDPEDAVVAIQKLDRQKHHDKILEVAYAKTRRVTNRRRDPRERRYRDSPRERQPYRRSRDQFSPPRSQVDDVSNLCNTYYQRYYENALRLKQGKELTMPEQDDKTGAIGALLQYESEKNESTFPPPPPRPEVPDSGRGRFDNHRSDRYRTPPRDRWIRDSRDRREDRYDDRFSRRGRGERERRDFRSDRGSGSRYEKEYERRTPEYSEENDRYRGHQQRDRTPPSHQTENSSNSQNQGTHQGTQGTPPPKSSSEEHSSSSNVQ